MYVTVWPLQGSTDKTIDTYVYGSRVSRCVSVSLGVKKATLHTTRVTSKLANGEPPKEFGSKVAIRWRLHCASYTRLQKNATSRTSCRPSHSMVTCSRRGNQCKLHRNCKDMADSIRNPTVVPLLTKAQVDAFEVVVSRILNHEGRAGKTFLSPYSRTERPRSPKAWMVWLVQERRKR